MTQLNTSQDISLLASLMQMHRPHGGANETGALIQIEQVIGAIDCGKPIAYQYDRTGNLICTVGSSRTVLFTAHVDTVHRAEGYSELARINNFIIAADAATGKDCVLGADDAAGCYLLVELIKAGTEGTYIFFVGEEVGGVGSSAFVRDNPDFKASIAIAFDRRGYSDVVTHQAGSRCCSDAFALALSKQLGMRYRPDDGGVYTDTAEFVDIVPECTNVSVGYFDEHRPTERLDIEHLLELRAALLLVDWEALPVERDPTVQESNWRSWVGGDYCTDVDWLHGLQRDHLADQAAALYEQYADADIPEDILQFLSDCIDNL